MSTHTQFISFDEKKADILHGRGEATIKNYGEVKYSALSSQGFEIVDVFCNIISTGRYYFEILTGSGQNIRFEIDNDATIKLRKYGRLIDYSLYEIVPAAKRDGWLLSCGEYILDYLIDRGMLYWLDCGGYSQLALPFFETKTSIRASKIIKGTFDEKWDILLIDISKYAKCKKCGKNTIVHDLEGQIFKQTGGKDSAMNKVFIECVKCSPIKDFYDNFNNESEDEIINKIEAAILISNLHQKK